MATTDAICNPDSFREEARWQRVCAVCGRGGAFQAHHVVHEQILKHYGLRGNALFNPNNALRLCTELRENCHSRHHWKMRPVRTVELTRQNLLYAFEIMGLYAADWLRRYYDDSHPDPRIRELELSYAQGTSAVESSHGI